MSFVDFFGNPTLFDPFIGDPVQSSRMKAFCQVYVDGVDITDKLDPHLESVRILDGDLTEAYLEIDDRDGRLPIPAARSSIKIYLGWASESMVKVFDGYTYDLEHGGSRREEGRKMWIHAWPSQRMMDEVKQPMQNNWGDGAPPGAEVGNMVGLHSVMSEAANHAKLNLAMHPRLGGIQRDYWSQNNESFLQLAQKMADEHGALFGLKGKDQAVMTYPGEEPDGSPSPVTAVAAWGRNLISWRVRPWAARSSWGGANQQFYDTAAGQWKLLSKGFSIAGPAGAAGAKFQLPTPAPYSGVAQQHNEGASSNASMESGEGRIVINGEPSARWNTFVQLVGARPGVDGAYRIRLAEHQWSRHTGYITWLEVNSWIGGSPANDFSAFPPAEQVGDFVPADGPSIG